jgi:hypothetical protein
VKIGASTFIWVSPFSNRTLDLIDRVKALGFDLIEICVEDPETIDVAAIAARAKSAAIGRYHLRRVWVGARSATRLPARHCCGKPAAPDG